MQRKLPKRLGREPLIEALFEMRFKAKAPVSSILPGLVFTTLKGSNKIIERLPAADLPEPLRKLDPNLRYAPTVRVHWDSFLILSSDQSAGVACKLPYPGWTSGFKPAILQVTELISKAGIVDLIERFSLKYTNIIPTDVGDARSVAKFTLKVGSHDAAGNLFQIRAEIPKDDLISIIQFAADASATLADGSTRKGVAIDIDTIAVFKEIPFPEFFGGLPDQLEKVHSEAKTIFFSCLKPDALAKLEPVYE
jgi:uncharacterized protein (TIGR04255 family)